MAATENFVLLLNMSAVNKNYAKNVLNFTDFRTCYFKPFNNL